MLSSKGVFYMLLEEENDPDEIAEILSKGGLATQVVVRKRAKNERLLVLKAYR